MITVEQWIASNVPGRSFVDVGGLWGTTGEKVTMAAQYGAAQLTMVDHCEDEDLWDKFYERAKGLQFHTYIQDVEAKWFASKVGVHDVVHCNGLLYHSANPFFFIQQLSQIVGSSLMLGSIHSGRASSTEESIFVPGLNRVRRNSIAQSYGFVEPAPAWGISIEETEWILPNGQPNARPFWWLHSKNTIKSMLELAGFQVEHIGDVWDGRVAQFFCKRKEQQ